MMKNLLASLRGQGATTTPEQAKGLVERAHAEFAQATTRLAAARETYGASLLHDDEKKTLAAQAEVMRCEAMIDRAQAAIGLAEEQHAAVQARADEAARRERYAAAETGIEAAKKALAEYGHHATAIRAIIKAVAEANVAMRAVNADLPKGAVPLVSAEKQVRGLPGIPQREVSRRALPDIWVYTGGCAAWGEVPPHFVADIKATGQTTGMLAKREPETGFVREFPVERRPGGVEITYMPEHPGVMPEALHTQIALPGLRAGAPPIWQPVGNLHWGGHEVGTDGATVLEEAAKRESARGQVAEELQPPGNPQSRIERPAAATAQPAAAA